MGFRAGRRKPSSSLSHGPTQRVSQSNRSILTYVCRHCTGNTYYTSVYMTAEHVLILVQYGMLQYVSCVILYSLYCIFIVLDVLLYLMY